MGNFLSGIRNLAVATPTARSEASAPQKLSEHHFNKQELRVMRQHLKDFACRRPARPQDCELVTWHWEQLNVIHYQPIDKTTGVAPIMKLFDTFYRFLFELAPDTKSLYHNSSQFQGRALLNIIGGVRTLLQSSDVFETAAAIAIRHVTYGVKCEYFNPFGVALMRTLEVLAPTLWTPQISEAWHRVYAHVSVLVLTRLSQERLLICQRPSMKIAVATDQPPDMKPRESVTKSLVQQPTAFITQSPNTSPVTAKGSAASSGRSRSPPRSRKSNGTENVFSDITNSLTSNAM